jgi:small nuclear ribonucleoprotein (snRNP)-like protein
MKRIYLNLFMLLVISLVSCKDDDNAEPAYNFKDQDATGKIENESWTYKDGYADIGSELIYVTLTIEQAGKACDITSPTGDRVLFTVDKEPTLYLLGGSGSTMYTATLLESDDTMNHIALEGAIEITSITNDTVSGKIDARVDDETFVNGNFTIPICQ